MQSQLGRRIYWSQVLVLIALCSRAFSQETAEVNQSGANGAFTTIQAAIDSGATEITITDSGVYEENLEIGDPEDGGPAVTLASTQTGDDRPVITPAAGKIYTEVHRSGNMDRGAGFGLFSSGSVLRNLVIEGNPDINDPNTNGLGALFVMADNVVIEDCVFRPAAGTFGSITFPNTLLFFAQQGADGVATPGGRDCDGTIVRNCELVGSAPDATLEPTLENRGYLASGENGQTETLARCDHFTNGEPVTITFEDCYLHHSFDAGIFPSDRSALAEPDDGPLLLVTNRCRFDGFGKFAVRGRGASVRVTDCVFSRTNQLPNGDGENSAVAIQANGSHVPNGEVTNCVFVNGGSANAFRAYFGGVNNHNAGVLTVEQSTFVSCLSGAGVGTGGGTGQTIVRNSIFHQIGFNSPPAVDVAGLPVAESADLDANDLYESWFFGLPINGGNFAPDSIWAAVFNNFRTADDPDTPTIVVENCLVGDIASEDDRPWADVVAAGLDQQDNVFGTRLVNGFTEATTVEGIDTVVRGVPLFMNTDVLGPHPYALAADSPGQGLGANLIFGTGPFHRGDCNQDGGVDLSDGVAMLNFSFLGADPPTCIAACDFNGDGAVDVTTAVYFFNALFQGGPGMPPPSGACGVSDRATDENLGCAASACN